MLDIRPGSPHAWGSGWRAAEADAKPADRAVELSVLLPLARERGVGLKALESWTGHQSFSRDRFEVIALTDGPVESDVLSRLGWNDRLLRRDGAGSVELWDLGARSARGHVLLFTEGHCVAERACVAEVLAALCNGDADAVCCESVGECPTAAAWLEDRIYQDGFELWSRSGDPRMVSFRGFAVWRADYLAVGGLDPRHHECFAERAVAIRLVERGVRIRRARRAVVRHRPNATFAGVRHDSEAFTRCEFSYRAANRSLPDNGLAFSPVWEARGDYDRELARAAFHAAMRELRQTFPELPRVALRAALGLRADLYVSSLALQLTRLGLALGRPFDGLVRRAYQQHWERFARGSGLRALAADPPTPTPVALPGCVPATDMPADRLFGFLPPERDSHGRPLRWTRTAAALRVPALVRAPHVVTLALHPVCRPTARLTVVANGRPLPASRVDLTQEGLRLSLSRSEGPPRTEVVIGLACSARRFGAQESRESRRLGLAVTTIGVEPTSP